MMVLLLLTGLGLVAKPGPEQALQSLRAGNDRFQPGKATRPHANNARIALSGKEDSSLRPDENKNEFADRVKQLSNLKASPTLLFPR